MWILNIKAAFVRVTYSPLWWKEPKFTQGINVQNIELGSKMVHYGVKSSMARVTQLLDFRVGNKERLFLGILWSCILWHEWKSDYLPYRSVYFQFWALIGLWQESLLICAELISNAKNMDWNDDYKLYMITVANGMIFKLSRKKTTKETNELLFSNHSLTMPIYTEDRYKAISGEILLELAPLTLLLFFTYDEYDGIRISLWS